MNNSNNIVQKRYDEIRKMWKLKVRIFTILAALAAIVHLSNCSFPPHNSAGVNSSDGLTAETAPLKLPEGFRAIVVADSIGKARHLAVNGNGDIYVKLGSLKDGKGIIYLQDTDGDGKADKRTGFGDYEGTGIYIRENYLYASSNEGVYRYQLNSEGKVAETESPEIIVKGLIDRRQHNSKSITLDHAGNIYVNIGAYSNACQILDRTEGSLGRNPCPVLDSAAGIWQFKADKQNQNYKEGIKYATGLRNVVGLDWNEELNQLFVMQHGRDQLFQLYPKIYSAAQGAELPAETMYALKKGDNCGWPYVYYDHLQKKKILAPEYGGDAVKTGGEKAIDPVVAFPGHLAPNGLLFYKGKMFPERYKNGAFIAFHGSWNRAPEKQMGYFVAFVPFRDGRPSGNWEIFANNFAGTDSVVSPGDAKHRPCGLAEGPDGSLYVSDDSRGTIYRILYTGAKKNEDASPVSKNSEEISNNISSMSVSAQRGKTIYTQYCLSCHQVDGSGVSQLNPPLKKSPYVMGQGSKLASIVMNGYNAGVEINGETYTNPMPSFGVLLKDEEIADVLNYIRNSFDNNADEVSVKLVSDSRKKPGDK